MLLPDIKLFQRAKVGLELVYLPHFVHGFRIKIFLCLYSTNWPSFIVRLFLFREILGNVCITIVYCPGWDVINFAINLIFLTKLFIYMTKKSRHKLKYLENISTFSSGLLLRQIKQFFFGRWESDFKFP